MADQVGKLQVREKIGYGFGDLASVLFWQTFMLYLLFFYTDVFGISAAAAGTILLVSRLWDGINDPMMGMIADRTKTRWGKYRPYLLWIALPFVIVGVFTFATPDLNISGKIIYAYITFTLLMMLYTAINIPYSSILGVITSSPKERTSVSSYKFVFAYIAGIIVSMSLLLMVDVVGKDNHSIIHVERKGSIYHIQEIGQGSAKVKAFATDSAGEKTKTEFTFRVNPEDSNLPILNKRISEKEFIYAGIDTVHVIDISESFHIKDKKAIKYEVTAFDEFSTVKSLDFFAKIKELFGSIGKKKTVTDSSVVRAMIDSTNLNSPKIILKERGIGSTRLTLKAEDKKWGSEETGFYVHVNAPGNHKPEIIKTIGDTIMKKDSKYSKIFLYDYFSDVDNDRLAFSANSSDEQIISARVEDDSLILLQKKTGVSGISLKASDKNGGTTEFNFRVTVFTGGGIYEKTVKNKDLSDSYKPKVIKTIENVTMKKDTSFKISLYDYIQVPDTCVCHVESSDEKIISAEIKHDSLSLLAKKTGKAKISIKSSENQNRIAELTFPVIVYNDAPYVNHSIDNVSKKIGAPIENYDLSKMYKDMPADSDTLTFMLDTSHVFGDDQKDQLEYSFEVVNYSKGWKNSFIIYGLAAFVFFMITFASVKERVKPLISQKTSVKKDLADLLHNKPWLLLLITTLLFILFVATRGSVTVHYFKYYVGEHQIRLFNKTLNWGYVELVSAFNTIGQICALLGVLVIPWLSKKIGKKNNFILFFIIACIATGVFYFLKPENLFLIFLFQIIGSFTGGPLSPLIWAMYADAADYSEWKTGRRATGLVFSASTMSQKFGWAFGAAVVGWLLSYFGFRANVDQSPEVLSGIKALMSIVPVGAGVLAIIIMLFYKLDEKQMKQIETDLLARRKNDK